MKYTSLLLICLFFITSCYREELYEVCCLEPSRYTYLGANNTDSLLWQPIDTFIWDRPFNRDQTLRIGLFRKFATPGTSFAFGETVLIKVPLERGMIQINSDSNIRYLHGFSDYGGDKYALDSTNVNYVEVLCVDTLTQMVSVAFDLHFKREGDPSYPFPEEVSFTNALFCGSYPDPQ